MLRGQLITELAIRPLAHPESVLFLSFSREATGGRFSDAAGEEIHLRWETPETATATATIFVDKATVAPTRMPKATRNGLAAAFSAEEFSRLPLYPTVVFVEVGGIAFHFGSQQAESFARFVGDVAVAFQFRPKDTRAVVGTDPSAESAAPAEATSDALKDPFVEPKPPQWAPPDRHDDRATDYRREDWTHWVDADGDCQDTRTEVLIAESSVPVTFTDEKQCKVRTGRWVCPYTGKVFTKPGDLDIDHFVALGNAGRSGGNGWSAEDKERYANDLEHEEHLVAVWKSANRSKSDKGPEAWLPPLAAYRCEYVRTWLSIKARWKLDLSDDERLAVRGYLEACDVGATIAVKQTPRRRRTTSEAKPRPASARETWTPRARSCCKVCSSGCPCGDSCISCNKRCRKGPGCAC